ncbi:Glycosyltransferase, GT2 family [Thermanaeromonas toyohensis ToBE]|uniref:Glycosyltransferase, GT2 family n=1 Tax=Thermanaeromonas toyohensis ToBE TaxID=698762 RepID=A0A1W1VTV2_9FIRM|nr:glycosyltransferase family 2 protein [Thermanaeromonas toyohensis]SMB96660.1 Glycosyltransferase, GT2 family [Thermanaeromonas toyohensis ToBE]
MLVSVVIPVCGNLELTRLCLETLEVFTRPEHEVVVVDNGSADGTEEFLAEAAEAGKIRLIRHERNLGFAKAVNDGIAVARGRYVVVLNNDVILTPRWLDNLLYCLEAVAGAGMVGPVSANVSGIQRVDADFSSLEELLAFADIWNRPDPAKWFETERLVGFCLVVKREVFDRIGLFDGRFGLGNFEDDDLCLRARLGGYRLVVAGDTYVHHVGSATFRSLGLDYAGLMRVNARKFARKWNLAFDPYRAFMGRLALDPWGNVRAEDVPVPGLYIVPHGTDGAPRELEELADGVFSASCYAGGGAWLLHVGLGEEWSGIGSLRAALDGPRESGLVAAVHRTPFGEAVCLSPRLEWPGTVAVRVLPGVSLRSERAPFPTGVPVPDEVALLERGVAWLCAGRSARAAECFGRVLASRNEVIVRAARFNLGLIERSAVHQRTS